MADDDLVITIVVKRRNGNKVLEVTGLATSEVLGWKAREPLGEIAQLDGFRLKNFALKTNLSNFELKGFGFSDSDMY